MAGGKLNSSPGTRLYQSDVNLNDKEKHEYGRGDPLIKFEDGGLARSDSSATPPTDLSAMRQVIREELRQPTTNVQATHSHMYVHTHTHTDIQSFKEFPSDSKYVYCRRNRRSVRIFIEEACGDSLN